MFINHYEVLEIRPFATEDEIKQAYDLLTARYHSEVDDDQQEHDTFVQVLQSYEVLINPASRFDFDVLLRQHLHMLHLQDIQHNFHSSLSATSDAEDAESPSVPYATGASFDPTANRPRGTIMAWFILVASIFFCLLGIAGFVMALASGENVLPAILLFLIGFVCSTFVGYVIWHVHQEAKTPPLHVQLQQTNDRIGKER